MKKSLIIRWTIIAIVLVVWTLAMFPLRDGDYLKTFEQVSAKSVAKCQENAKVLLAKGNPETIRKDLAAAAKDSENYTKLTKQLADLQADKNYQDYVAERDYQELQKRLALIGHADKAGDVAAVQAKLNKLGNADSDEAAQLKKELEALQADPQFKAWAESPEGKAYAARTAWIAARDQFEAQTERRSPAAQELSKKADTLKTAYEEAAKALDEETRNRLSLTDHLERKISGFRALEKAANGNSDLYRIALNQFVHIPFHGKSSNKLILRYLRVKSAGKLHLGLDLRGGTEFVLDFDENEAKGLLVTDKVVSTFLSGVFNGDETYLKALPAELKADIDKIANPLKAAGKSNEEIATAISANRETGDAVRSFLSAHKSLVKVKGEETDYGSVIEIRDRILSILDNRLNSMGVTEPEIKATGDNTISVRMPSVDEADKNEIRNTIKRAAKLEFYLVAENSSELVQAYEADRQNFRSPAGVTRAEIEEELSDGSIRYETIFLESKPTEVKGEDIERAFPTTNEFGQWRISLKFNAAGTIAFREVTRANVGRLLAIVLDGRVYSAPRLKEAIEGGQAEISGSFTMEEARRLASVIASGNVPVTVNIGSEFGTDPTLGADSVSAGVKASLLGLAIVIVFMILYYHVAGVVAVIALAVNTVLVLGTMAITKATITMPGIAGMVLTIGMAVDANVIIFERIREEIQSGSVVGNAIKGGYNKAFSAIFDSNITTLLTAFFLYNFGSGSIKGFAVTLSFGILASMFTAIFMTRAIFDLLVATDCIKTINMSIFPWFKKLDIDYMGKAKIAVGISVVFIVASLATFIVRGHNMLGIDFLGGTQMAYTCQGTAPDVKAVREYLVKEGYTDNVRVGYKRGQSGEPLLEIVLPIEKVDGKEVNMDYTEFSEKLDKMFPQCRISLSQTNNVGANVGSQFRVAAFWAALFSTLGIIVYLAFRFEFMYGIGATIAIVHDAIVSVGLFAMMGGNFSLTVVAAAMTIMGYSLNDTIVIFDRIREMKDERKDLTYSQQINKAINECMSRTILTSITTMFVVVAQLVFGGGAIADFAWVMFFGIITGTYSTIFVACSYINKYHKTSISDEKAELKFKAQQAKAAKEAAKLASQNRA